MNNTVIAAGMVVKSMAGHDSGSYYAVMRVENGFAYIADGKLRKVERPKKKNPLHLQKTLTTVELAEIKQKTKICVIGSEPKCRQHRRGE